MFLRNLYNLIFSFNIVLLLIHSLSGGSVDIAKGCALESHGFVSQCRHDYPFLHSFQTVPGAQPVSYAMNTVGKAFGDCC
jgi:hypothetical protein